MGAQSDRREIAAGQAAVHRRVRELLDDGLYLNGPDFMFSGCLRGAVRFPVDTAALPEELAEKVAAREKVFGKSPAPYMDGYREDPSLRTPRLVFVLIAVLVLLPFLLGYGLMKVDIPAPAAWSLEFTPWALAALTPLAIRVRSCWRFCRSALDVRFCRTYLGHWCP